MDNPTPLKKFVVGSIKASIWQNIGKNRDEEYTYKTVTLAKSYKNKNNDWVNCKISLQQDEIAKAILVLRKAQEEVLLKIEENMQSKNEENIK